MFMCSCGAQSCEHDLLTETTWRAAGRGGEAGWLHLDQIEWDDELDNTFVTIAQTKTSKMKKSAIVVGACRHSCWYLKLADYLINYKHRPAQNEEAPTWLFPEVQQVKSPSKKLADYMKSVTIGADGKAINSTYAKVAIDSLPSGICAASIRAGACNLLVTAMPCEFATETTGHDRKHISSRSNYVDASHPMAMPGGIV